MGIVKRAADLVYTFRFLRLLTTNFEDTEAYKAGIIDEKGKRRKEFTTDNIYDREKYKEYYTPFHRLVFNIKKLIPMGKLGSYAAALYLIKEKYGVNDKQIDHALKLMDVDTTDIMVESSQWLVLEDLRLSPGTYKVKGTKLLNDSLDEMVNPKDVVIVDHKAFPVGEVFGMNIYEATHKRTNKKVYITIDELM